VICIGGVIMIGKGATDIEDYQGYSGGEFTSKLWSILIL
jgi:hypothetical protein